MRLGRGAVLAMVALGVACNAVLGTEADYQLINGATADQCLLNSDCAAKKKCIFKTCSIECNGDEDCEVGLRCLKEGEGSAACASSTLAACGVGDQVCPAGTICKAGSCRNECVVGQVDCLSNQTCVSGVCVGLSEPPDVLAVAGFGTGGDASMSGGASAGGAVASGGSGGIGLAISGGTTGAGGVLAAGGAGGNMGGTHAAGGSGGASPSTLGAVGQPCVAGSYGCEGHAQRQQLVCQGGFWVANGTCQAGDSCDTRPGVTAGTCGPIVSDCVGKQPMEVTCQGTSRVQCDEDLLSTRHVEVCAGGCVAGLCTTCVPTLTRCTDNAVETCDSNGSWGVGMACTNQACVNGACTGNCTPLTTQCADKFGVQTCSAAGAWGGAVDCTNQACVTGACTGTCDPDTERCSSNTPQRCNASGVWTDKAAQCSSPSTICKLAPPNTSCVSNPPYYVGESAALPTGNALAANYLFAMPLVISTKTRLLDLGLIGRTSSSAFVTMALYTDVSGQPGALLQSTTEKQLAVGQVTMTPINALTVSAGTYWLVAIFNANANSYEAASGGASYRYVSGAYATFPANFPASTLVSNTKLNFYARVQDQP